MDESLPMNTTATVYIAGKFSARTRLRVMREALTKRGLRVTASWLDEPVPAGGDDGYEPLQFEAAAHQNVKEILGADLVIEDTMDASVTGGREFEIGLAHAAEIPFWVVGPARHVFHTLAQRRFVTWGAALRHLDAAS